MRCTPPEGTPLSHGLWNGNGTPAGEGTPRGVQSPAGDESAPCVLPAKPPRNAGCWIYLLITGAQRGVQALSLLFCFVLCTDMGEAATTSSGRTKGAATDCTGPRDKPAGRNATQGGGGKELGTVFNQPHSTCRS